LRGGASQFHASSHPIVKSFEPGENWGWRYVDRLELDFARADINHANGHYYDLSLKSSEKR
jgi:hypothetical protein